MFSIVGMHPCINQRDVLLGDQLLPLVLVLPPFWLGFGFSVLLRFVFVAPEA